MIGINDGLTYYQNHHSSLVQKLLSNLRTYKLIYAGIKSLHDNKIEKSREIFQHAEKLRRSRPTLESQSFYEKAIELDPEYIEAYIKLIALLRFHDKIETAEYWYNRGKLNLNYRSYNIHEALVIEAYNADCCYDDDVQESKLLESIRINPTNDIAWAALGSLFFRQKKMEEATKALSTALLHNPRNDRAHGLLASLYMNHNQYAEAERLYKTIITLHPNDYRGYAGLKNTYERSGNYDKLKELQKRINSLTIDDFSVITKHNYLKLLEITRAKRIQLVASQYPLRDIKKLKKILDDADDVIYVDNRDTFIEIVDTYGYNKVFTDYFAGDFCHMSTLGKKTLAKNVADTILSSFIEQGESLCDLNN